MRRYSLVPVALVVWLATAAPVLSQTGALRARGLLDLARFPTYCMQESHWIQDPCTGEEVLLDDRLMDLDRYLCTYVEVSGLDVGVECEIIGAMSVLPLALPCGVEVRNVRTYSGSGRLWMTWTPLACADAIDVIRGRLPGPTLQPDAVDLGPVACVAEDLPGTTYSLFIDALGDPPPGGVHFFLIRARGEPYGLTPYGFSSAGLERIPSEGDCAQ